MYDHEMKEIYRVLVRAANNGDITTVRSIIGAHDVIPADNIALALRRAAENGHAEVVEALLDRGLDPGGRVALLSGITFGHENVVAACLRNHQFVAEVLDQFTFDRALQDAILTNHRGVVQQLLSVRRFAPSLYHLRVALDASPHGAELLLADPRIDAEAALREAAA